MTHKFSCSKQLRAFTAAFLALVIFATASTAEANLIVAPTRVVFGPKDKSDTVLLMNTDKEAHTYRIGVVIARVAENGRYEEIPQEPDNPHVVPNMIKFSPRRVRIEAGGRQSIRLSLRRPADLPVGEYRGHLVLETVPQSEEKGKYYGSEPGKKSDDRGATINIKLNIGFGVSIPVMVRNGALPAPGLTIEDVQILPPEGNDPRQRLSFALAHEEGTASAYGVVNVMAQIGDKQENIGLKNNLSVYADQSKRIVVIPLKQDVPAGAAVKIVYDGIAEYAGKTLAEKTISVTK